MSTLRNIIKAGMLSSPFLTATQATAEVKTPYPDASYQTADIGDHFTFMEENKQNNKLIQDIDDLFVGILEDLFNADPDNFSDSALEKEHYGRYSDKISEILGVPYHEIDANNPHLIDTVDICKKIEIETFFGGFLTRLKPFIAESYTVSPDFQSRLDRIEPLLHQLRATNRVELDQALQKESAPYCQFMLS